MKILGTLLVLLGAIALIGAGVSGLEAPNVSHLIGTSLPGLILVIFGLKIQERKSKTPDSLAQKPQVSELLQEADAETKARSNSFKSKANVGFVAFFILMFFDSAVAQRAVAEHATSGL